MNNIIVVGSANVDLVIHSARMPKLGETLTGSNFQTNAGGKGLNQAVAIAKSGGNISFLGAVGNESHGDFLRRTLDEYGIHFEGFVTDKAPTGTALITVVNADNFILLDPGANATLTPEIIETKRQQIAESDFCVMQLEIPMETVLKVMEIASSSGTKIVLNPAPFQMLPVALYPLVDYLVPNEHEAELLTGIHIDNEESAIKAIRRIQELGVKNVVITLGEKGSVYTDSNEVLFCPAEKVIAVDTTSAGDCFIGALVTKLSQGNPIREAIQFATKASAITVSRPGAAVSIPFAHEIQ